MRIVRATVVLLIASFFALMWGLVLRERIDLARAVPLAQGYDALLAPDEENRRIVMGRQDAARRDHDEHREAGGGLDRGCQQHAPGPA
jgi:hypothetical protein